MLLYVIGESNIGLGVRQGCPQISEVAHPAQWETTIAGKA